MTGQTARLDDGRINDGPEFLRSERVIVVDQAALAVDAGVLQRMNAFGQADFGHREGAADHLDLGGGLDLALGEHVAAGGFEAHLQVAELAGKAEWKLIRNPDTLDAV